MGNKAGQRSGKAADVVPLVRRQCPICGKPQEAEYRPFCSKRCADIDLGRWLNEDYRIPTDEAPDPFAGDAGAEAEEDA